LETGYAWKGIREIFQKEGRAHAREFAGLIKRILPTANPVEIQEKYAGGGSDMTSITGMKTCRSTIQPD